MFFYEVSLKVTTPQSKEVVKELDRIIPEHVYLVASARELSHAVAALFVKNKLIDINSHILSYTFVANKSAQVAGSMTVIRNEGSSEFPIASLELAVEEVINDYAVASPPVIKANMMDLIENIIFHSEEDTQLHAGGELKYAIDLKGTQQYAEASCKESRIEGSLYYNIGVGDFGMLVDGAGELGCIAADPKLQVWLQGLMEYIAPRLDYVGTTFTIPVSDVQNFIPSSETTEYITMIS